jgi:hypothetical protein
VPGGHDHVSNIVEFSPSMFFPPITAVKETILCLINIKCKSYLLLQISCRVGDTSFYRGLVSKGYEIMLSMLLRGKGKETV